jgi:hypothetical protein
MTDELGALGLAERAEDGHAREDARHGLGVHGAERYARACALIATAVRQEPHIDRGKRIAHDTDVSVADA